MEKQEIIEQLKQYFDIEELVCNHIIERYDGEKAWLFLHKDLLHTLLVLRKDILKVPLYCNIHKNCLTQRGLRCNLCEIVKNKTDNGNLYMSAHVLGSALDLISPEMTAKEMRKAIMSEADKLPCNVRIEDNVDWLHIDIYDTGNRVYLFMP